jgi:hypothetical protein
LVKLAITSRRDSSLARRGVFLFAMLAALAVAGLAPGHAAAQATRNMVYKVTHSTYGDIGTYSNLVQTSGDTTTVTTTVHLAVKVLGIVMHREDDQRTEEWKNNRLVAFHGVTDKNGDKIVVNGKAHDDSFVITTPSGTYAAPASVHPANPWSMASLQSTTMMQVDTGKVNPVKVLGGGETTVDVNGTKVAAREYQIDGGRRSLVWVDQQGVPVKFTVEDDTGVVSFTLVR